MRPRRDNLGKKKNGKKKKIRASSRPNLTMRILSNLGRDHGLEWGTCFFLQKRKGHREGGRGRGFMKKALGARSKSSITGYS